ncbi:hypothetical protein N7532_009999 [Penicillium argentinense]|uniref:Dynamin GTPase n=1 Tax=Penicillium argentinense TaxID=1131581 RepID=A0A9W9JXI2_9EURO|nr:uncharacterized protein N7532_009999 [Penicillium argentinense]KAJ5085228.1 hypothetical protein N7532_009999 [Penicillium argentinense]
MMAEEITTNPPGPPEAHEKASLGTDRMRRWLNQIAQARAHGIGDCISLPQIIVCGDQSVGKSSVLEGITSVPFPRKDGLCTRFATEIILHDVPQQDTSITASIIPHPSRNDATFESLKNYSRSLSGYGELADVVEDVSKRMGLKTYTENDADAPAFVADILRIEVTGPTGLHLTIVDLPGLIEGSEDEEAVELVSKLVDNYLKESRTIILAVFPAGNDIETQPIIRRARSFDKSGKRTVGIITKADLINRGTEDRIAALMQNQGPIKIDLGFFLLKNPDPEQLAKGISVERRQAEEEEYFRKEKWKVHDLDSSRVGVRALRSYCQVLLERHFERELPKVREDVTKLLEESQKELADLGEERNTPMIQRLYLSKLSMKFCELVRSSIDGRYHDHGSRFFDPDQGDALHNRLRALVHLLNASFADFMRTSSHKRLVEEVKYADSTSSLTFEKDAANHHLDTLGKPETISLMEFNNWILSVYKSTRGLELSGSYSHNLLSCLFHEQASRWPAIARTHVRVVHYHVTAFLERTLAHVVKEEDLRFQLQMTISTSSQRILQEALDELAKICDDEEIQPITYNHYFTDNIQKSRQDSMKNEIENALTRTMNSWGNFHVSNTSGDRAALLSSLQEQIKVDMDLQTCDEAYTALSSYYKVAMKTFVDNVCRQVVERHIMRTLPSIFEPSTVVRMSDEDIERIAVEPEKNTRRRKKLQDMVDALQKCFGGLQV